MKFKKKKLNKNPFAVQINPDPKKSAEFFNMAMTTGDIPTGLIGAMAEEFNKEAVDINQFTFTDYLNPDGQRHPKCKTYRSTLEYMASETERLFNNALHTYWGETKPYKQLVISYMNLNKHSCIRDLVGPGAEQGLKDAQSAIFKRQHELLELSKQFTEWNGKEWVKSSMNENLDFYGDENVYFYNGKVYARENDEYIATIMKKVTANSKEEAIKKIIRSFKIEHIESLLKYFRGYKTNLYIEEDKVRELGLTKEFERYLELVASKQKEVETKVDDPKYNFDDYDKKDNYEVK